MVTDFKRQYVLGGTAAQWASNSAFIPQARELCVETDTGQMKIGDGVNAYSALAYVGATFGQTFATEAEVQAGTVANKVVAPDTLAAVYPQAYSGASEEQIPNDWRFNGIARFSGVTIVDLAPRTGATGNRDAVARADVEGYFAGTTSAGSGDANKAPTLDANGKIDESFISAGALPSFRGFFNPATASPTLIDQVGGGLSPDANNGDYLLCNADGFYNFATGIPGAGTELVEGDQVVFDTTTAQWGVIRPGGLATDPGAVRRSPGAAADSTIQAQLATLDTLSLQLHPVQTGNLLALLNNSGTLIGGIDQDLIATLASANVLSSLGNTAIATDFPAGLSFINAGTASGWPTDGPVITIRIVDFATQLQFGADKIFIRRYTTSWSSWIEWAPKNDPALTGNVTVPTPALGTNNTQPLTTAGAISEKERYGLFVSRVETNPAIFQFTANAAFEPLSEFFDPPVFGSEFWTQDVAPNPAYYLVPVTGWYQIHVNADFTANKQEWIRGLLEVHGYNLGFSRKVIEAPPSFSTFLSIGTSFLAQLTAGEQLGLRFYGDPQVVGDPPTVRANRIDFSVEFKGWYNR